MEFEFQVDAALGAEEMVENLGLQKLALEDEIKELKEAVSDLEALQDINDQLQEDSRELELQLREEADMANAAMREVRLPLSSCRTTFFSYFAFFFQYRQNEKKRTLWNH